MLSRLKDALREKLGWRGQVDGVGGPLIATPGWIQERRTVIVPGHAQEAGSRAHFSSPRWHQPCEWLPPLQKSSDVGSHTLLPAALERILYGLLAIVL